ncbi:MAG TPA: glutathione S-transferase family protein [Pseudoxanthomonas sp.]|nr:glutathione S-transferase family protein [Pseudoxanthomonas sp.]
MPFERRDIDLGRKPDWFLSLTPTGKTPLMLVGETPIFESSVICEYLDEVHEPRLHPVAALDRAEHRSWMEFASTVLVTIAALYSAAIGEALAERARALRNLLERVEQALGDGPYFAGAMFSMVDAAFAPALRYFEVIEDKGCFGFFQGLPKLGAWRQRLAARPSVRQAVASDYSRQLHVFLLNRGTALSAVLRGDASAP